MYKLVVGHISHARKKDWNRIDENPYSVWDGKPIAAQVCTISALSSADYCLRNRIEVDWGSVAWKGRRKEILRLFEAEGLDTSPLRQLNPWKNYAVIFIEFCWADCA
jgi:hypothetical protein